MFEEVCYARNYLTEVICRLDFASQVNELKNSMPKVIYDAVKKHFPIAEPQDVVGTELSINPIMPPVFNQVALKQWAFLSRNRKNKCTIDTNAIIFSIGDYNVFEELSSAIIDIIGAVMSNYPQNQGKRFGLRYINNLPLKDHSDWIDDKFIAAFSAHKDEKTTKLITTLEYAVQDKDLNVRLVYGYDNPDYPAIMKKENFIIDIDAYSTGIIYFEDIAKFIENMHGEVQSCFEKMITDRYREAVRNA